MSEKRWNRHHWIALIVAILLHAGVLISLLFIVLPAIHLEERSGILVNIGDVEFAQGAFSSMPYSPPPTPSQPPKAIKKPAKESLLTQEVETEAPAIQSAKERKEQEEARKAEQRRVEEQRRREAEEAERKRQEAIRRSVSGAFGTAQEKSQSTGESAEGQVGKEGSKDGNVSSGGVNSGVGGFGSFSLSGRSLGGSGLPRPEYSVAIEGTIVIEITVDPSGRVISTRIAQGTTISNYELRQSALRAASRARFNAIDGLNNQIGTITYRYRLN